MSVRSSGRLEQLLTVTRECDAQSDDGYDCEFNDDVEASYDPEMSTSQSVWTCPDCGTDYWEDFE